ncbi:MAG TPA: UrcA family protein [Rhizomicrobium sp.]|nr:UrcA family protein [Rhizomicrobium sp.]
MQIRTAALLLVTSAVGLAFGGSALAGPCGTYGGYDPKGPPPENITVTAPRMQYGPYRLNVPPEKVSMSQAVQFADLNLCSAAGVHELRLRTITAAYNICKQLSQMYPHALTGSPSCYRDALTTAQPKVDFAIANARGTR